MLSGFAWREGLDGEGVHRSGQLLRQGGVDLALPLDTALAGEGAGRDLDGEVALAARPGARMAGVLGAVVDHVQLDGIEAGLQFLSDGFGNGGHIVSSILERKNFYLIIDP